MPFYPENGSPITQLTGFSCRLLGGGAALALSVTVGEGEGAQTRETVVAINAAGGRP
jgi:hypothetical protein